MTSLGPPPEGFQMKAIGSLVSQQPVIETFPVSSFRLSVLVPAYNERYVVEASLRRVLKLRHKLIRSLELVVVDDHSTDGTWEVLQRVAAEDERVILLRHERNLGKGAAIRTAITHAWLGRHQSDRRCR